ncbi:MAG: hypothetical protein KKD97_16275 [Gammaproteobacteria bacterium]|nr:hypothetical protein [Gammaproteobacteria bacterium]
MKALTQAQTKVLDWIKRYIGNHGFAPTRSEIAEAMGFSSTNAAEDHLQALARKGAIRITPRVARSIVVVNKEQPGAGPWPNSSAG